MIFKNKYIAFWEGVLQKEIGSEVWLLFYLPRSKRKERTVYISCFYFVLATQICEWGSMKYFILEKGSTYEKAWKALTSRLVSVSHISGWHWNANFFSTFSGRNILSSNHYVVDVQLFLNFSSLHFMLVFNVVVMLIMCTLVTGSVRWKLYALTRFEMNTGCI